MQSIHIPEDKKLPSKLHANRCLFGLLSETNLIPRVIFLFLKPRGGESKGNNTPES